MRIKRFISELCILTHRASSSQNEYRSATHILELMNSLGLKTKLDEFKSQKSLVGELVTILLFFIIASAFSFVKPWLGFLLGVMGAILFWGYFSNQFKPIAPLFRHSKSYNVIGRFPNESAIYKVIFTAHHDTARSSPLWHPKRVASFRFSFLTGVALLLLLLIFLLLKALKINFLFTNIFIILLCVYILGQIIILIYGRITGTLIQGANDNASGVAVILDLAAKLKESSFPDFEFWFASTGSEEVGAIGMVNFMKNYKSKFSKETTYFINIDNVGSGQLHYYLGEGMLNFYKFSDELIQTAQKVVAKKEFIAVTPKKYRVAYTDAIIPASKGYHAILLLATDERDVIPNWHWETDNLDNIDFRTVEKTSNFTFEMVRQLNNDLIKKVEEEKRNRKE